jgi:hypothetical protein
MRVRFPVKKMWLGIGLGLSTVLAVVGASLHRRTPPAPPPAPIPPVPAFFSDRYPVNTHFLQELQLLRSQGKLKPKNEERIVQAIEKSGGTLKMPPAVLWCLLFQESRLNHLEGWHSNRHARGIGQFSFFSFYEINHHLDRFVADNLALFQQTLGRDIRPLVADEDRLDNPSSYYYIPTAVTASAAYLNNRYHHLRQILEKRKYGYQPDLLWLYAAMAYNKGTRSVLALWNDALRHGGVAGLEAILTDQKKFRASVSDSRTVYRTLKRIWPANQAVPYATELRIHLKNMWDCAVSREQAALDPLPGEEDAR